MKYMKYIPGILGVLFALYTGYQSFEIASAGAVNEIPQLEGDGGGGVTLSALCLLAAIVTFIKPFLSIPIFMLATVICLITGYIYYDNLMYVWGAGTVVLAAVSYIMHRSQRNKKVTKSRILA